MDEKKELFFGSIKDMVADLFYYDRKNDDELSEEDVEELIENKKITLKEMVEVFSNEIKENFPELDD